MSCFIEPVWKHHDRVLFEVWCYHGLSGGVAGNSAELVELAARKTGDIAQLAALRRALRQKMEDSPVMDAVGFTRLEAAYKAR